MFGKTNQRLSGNTWLRTKENARRTFPAEPGSGVSAQRSRRWGVLLGGGDGPGSES